MQRPSQIPVNELDIPVPSIASLPTHKPDTVERSRLFLFMHSEFMIHDGDMYAGRYLETNLKISTYHWV